MISMADLAAVVFKIWDEVILLGNKKLVLQGTQVAGYIDAYEAKLEKNDSLSVEQKEVIGTISLQLKSICNSVRRIEDPMLGTLSSLQEERNV